MENSVVPGTSFGIREIMKILPHRYPFLLVDKILEVDPDKSTIIGQKNLTMNEDFFQGHFPDAPVMPGVLILEALAQTGGVLIHSKGYRGKAALVSVKNAKFRTPVHPGDVLTLECEGIHFSARAGKVKAVATVDGKLAAEAEMGFVLIESEDF